MKENFIETRKVWYLNHLQKPFKKFKHYDIKQSIKLQKNSICIPSSTNLSQKEQKKIILLIKQSIR